MKRTGILAVAVLLVGAALVSAQPKEDDFFVVMDGFNGINTSASGGTGWNDGQWIGYPETGWWNQWFYDDPFTWDRWKHIDYEIYIGQPCTEDAWVDVVINYSTPAYTPPVVPDPTIEPPQPNTPDWEAAMINRERVVYSGLASEAGTDAYIGGFDIPMYNPEWVSIDVRTSEGTAGVDVVAVDGTIWHECIDEPAVHEPLLNWDFIAPDIGVDINDLEIVVANPNFNPQEANGDVIGVGPNWMYDAAGIQNDYDHDGNPNTPGTTLLRWTTMDGAPLMVGDIIHGGLNMNGAGRILDAWWTMDGQKVADIVIIDEETWTWREPFDPTGWPPGGGPAPRPEGMIQMLLGTDEAFEDPDGGVVELRNVEAWVNILSETLGLDELNASLIVEDLILENQGLGNFDIAQVIDGGLYNVDSFFDVFVDIDIPGAGFLNPDRSSLLRAEVWIFRENDPTDPLDDEEIQVGTFWNLNQQCPEPATLAMLGLGGALTLMLRRRRRA